jgi:predicted ATPase
VRINTLQISRFKSIKEIALGCRKVNVFIGPPDTGKTNILEALNFLSRLGLGAPIGTSLRLRADQGFEPLFHRQFFDSPIEIKIDAMTVSTSLEGADRHLVVRVSNPQASDGVIFQFDATYSPLHQFQQIRFYGFSGAEVWQYGGNTTSVVMPPDGWNLMYVARHNEQVYNFLKEQVAGLDWKLRFDQAAKRFRLSEVRQDDIIDYNLELLSDSIKRFFFFGAILLTSKDAVLVFDEPDVQAFPPYPKLLGRMIADDESNQFFLTTHNPYLLAELAEKTKAEDLAIFICRRNSEGGTEARRLDLPEVQEIIGWGPDTFFNLSRLSAW